MDHDTELRRQLSKILDWEDAHASFDSAVKDIPPKLRGATPPGLAHSPVAAPGAPAAHAVGHPRLLVLRVHREEPASMDEYWPPSAAPPSDKAWDDSVAAIKHDRAQLQRLAGDKSVDLFAKIPHGSGQTILRELLLVADHTAYHVGQLVDARRALGIWG